jgi:hypothetical protein
MFSALYYPHTEFHGWGKSTQRLLKRALLLWDELWFIVPEKGQHRYHTPQLAEQALELVAREHVATEQEKEAAHADLEELITRPTLPDAFLFSGDSPYEIYPQKFLPKTWLMLQEGNLARLSDRSAHYQVPLQAGLMAMSMLADACAGSTKRRVTDRGQAYAGLMSLLGDDQARDGHERGELFDRVVDTTVHVVSRPGRQKKKGLGDRIVALNLELIDVDRLTLEQLIDFRTREEKEGGHTLRELRHSYVKRIENQVKLLASVDSSSDYDELARQFNQEMTDDLRSIRQELRMEAKLLLVSREVITAFIASSATIAASMFALPIGVEGAVTVTGAPCAIGGVIAACTKFTKARTEILRKHPMAYLYEIAQ